MIKTCILTASVSRRAGGPFESVRRLGQSLQECGVDVQAFSLRDNFTDEDVRLWHPIKPRVFEPLRPYGFSYAPGLASEIVKLNLDLIHLHGIWMYPSVACAYWARKTKCPYIISPRGTLDPWAVRNSHWKKTIASFLFERANLKKASCLHALNDSEMISIKKYGLKNPVCVIPNGIDLPKQDEKPAPPWKEAGIIGRKVILYLGRIHPKKGLVSLLQGWAILKRQNGGLLEDWALVIAGWDQAGHESELKKLAADLQVQDSVRFIGPQFNENKLAAYSNADAFVLPSFSEGLPMVVLEAWAHKLPVLMTPECNLPEGFRTGSAIEISTVPEDIADGLLHLLSISDEERKAMGAMGLKLVEERFAWPKIASDMKSVYEWILGGGDAPGCVKN